MMIQTLAQCYVVAFAVFFFVLTDVQRGRVRQTVIRRPLLDRQGEHSGKLMHTFKASEQSEGMNE